MKAKLLIMALAATSCSLVANAQEGASAMSSTPAKNVAFARDGGHWFIDVQWGAGITLFGDNHWAQKNDKINFGDRISYLNPTFSIGKWHNPYFATRAQFMGWNLYDHVKVTGGNTEKAERIENYYVAGHYDFMFDVINYFAPYRANRVFHLIPFVGLGIGYNFKQIDSKDKDTNPERLTPMVNAGLMMKFRLSRVVDFNLEAQAIAHRFHFLGTNNAENKSDINAFLTAGLTFNLGKTEWEPVIPMDYALVNDLNNQINSLRAQNEELSKRPVSCPECPENVVTENIVVGNIVYFRINSAHIDANQMINIYNTAEYAKNNTETITLVGYADRDTGTAEYNFKLSERRAKAVADVLVNKYGISRDRIKIDWKGSNEQPYSENVWNRIVIMNAEK
ncbi:OmpA family protein [Porphyromonas macacae]|uniref:PG33 n=1 Tax=Porphyromonas macacae TaxID=28115 RepID=A0A379DIX1_9PORP|nr:OmpA family protein [Porphyromonas macacae]SUB78286.1 PG33 [Porphyromonas macacae]